MMGEARLDEQTRNTLIELVKSRPILFNDIPDRAPAELRDERQKCWEEIGAQLGMNGTYNKQNKYYFVLFFISIKV